MLNRAKIVINATKPVLMIIQKKVRIKDASVLPYPSPENKKKWREEQKKSMKSKQLYPQFRVINYY
jgi:hypothetical protein